MKYLNNGGFNKHPMMQTTLLLSLLFITSFIVVNFILFFLKMDLTPGSIASYYLGNEDEFRPSRSIQSMIEVSHSHLAMMALLLLLLTHLIIFAPFSARVKYTFIIGSFLSGFLNEVSNYLIRFIDPVFSWLKIFSFLSLQGFLTFMVLSLSIYIIRTKYEQPREQSAEIDE